MKSPKKLARLLCSHVYLMPVQLSFLFKKIIKEIMIDNGGKITIREK